MKKQKNILILAAILILLVFAGCSEQSPTEGTTDDPQLKLTIEELATYNGKDGNPAYVAVDGIIYDVSDSPKWKDGEHNGHSAGQDLTDVIKNESPHGVSILSRMPIVGEIVE